VAGQRVGRYGVVEVIGTGAFATVLRARDERLDADVAVKVLAENHSLSPDIRERFVSEGQLLRRVRSPHVVDVHDLSETDAGQPFLVLELARGGDLAARRRITGPPAPGSPDLLTVVRHVADALSALHAERVVHRDLTPGNLLLVGGDGSASGGLVGPHERLVLADLGLSKDLAAASGLTVGTGTAGFTPPEQGAGGWVDERADIWSASALVVWLLLGRPPGQDRTWVREVQRLGWPVELTTVLARGLDVRPARRQASAVEWADQVAAALRPPEPPSAPASGHRPGPRRRRLLVGTAVVVLVAALAGGWWLGRYGPGGVPQQETLPDGRVQVRTSDGALRVAVTGPAQVSAGSTAVFVAELEGARTWVWVAPDGTRFDDVPQIEVATRTAGLAEVTLVAVAEDGSRASVEHQLVVRP